MRFFTDLHDHISVMPYNMGDRNRVGMRYRRNNVIKDGFGPDTQSDLVKLMRGNVRVVFNSLCPIETGFMKLRGHEGVIADEGISLYTGFPPARIDALQKPDHDYLKDMMGELSMLVADEGKELSFEEWPQKCMFKVVNSYQELASFVGINERYEIDNPGVGVARIGVVLTVEGVHCLFNKPLEGYKYNFNDMNDPGTSQLWESVKQNVKQLRHNNTGKRVFAVTFAHHFYNKMCGQSISFTRSIDYIFQQGDYTDTGFSEFGKSLIRELCMEGIVIDVKHLSVTSRQWLYKQDFTQNIPVMASHSAVNGCATMELSKALNHNHDEANRKYKDSSTFNTWDINLSDEEIYEIAKRGGIIGLSLDQRIIMGKANLRNIQLLGKIPFMCKNNWCKPLYQNALYIAKALDRAGYKRENLWDYVSIGSDFDGMINPINDVKTAQDFPAMEESLLVIFKKNKRDEALLKNLSDNEIAQIVRKMCSTNALKFLQRNFT